MRSNHCIPFVVASVVASSVPSMAYADPSPDSAKRGFAGTSSVYTNAMNTNWYYNWGRTAISGARGEYVPMAWSAASVTNTSNYNQLFGHSSAYVLGFNEPERVDQANMTVDRAIELWPQLMATGKKLVSPAVSDTVEGRAWITDFMAKIKLNNYRVDAIAFHWYGDTRPTNAYSGFLSRVDWYHDTFTDSSGAKLPVWITEFSGKDFSGGTNPITQAMNETFLAGALPGLDARGYVERYAWWQNDPENTFGSGNPYTPSAVGDLYNGRSYDEGQTVVLVGNEGDDTFYLHGGQIDSNGGANTLRFVDAIDGLSEFGGTANWSIANGWARVRAGATLRKYDANTVSLVAIPVYNDGNLFVKGGSLRLADGAIVSGTGLLKTETGSDITLEQTAGTGGVRIDNALQLAAGKLNVLAGSHVLNGNLVMSNGSTMVVSGTLALNGGITGAGVLTKQGAGTLRVNAGATNTGAVTISAGTLQVANATGNATGTGALTIAAAGTLVGDGLIGAPTTVNGTLAPGYAAVAGRALRFTNTLALGSGATSTFTVNGASVGQVSSTASIALAGTLALTTIAAPSDLSPLTILSGASVTGKFATVDGIPVSGQSNRSLAVRYTANSVTVTQTLSGDVNVDGMVSYADLQILAAYYNTTNDVWVTGDLTGDGKTNSADLALVQSTYNQSLVGPAGTGNFEFDWARAQGLPVPEPTSTLTLAAGTSLLAFRRRRQRRRVA